MGRKIDQKICPSNFSISQHKLSYSFIQREETIKEESLKDQFLVEEKRGHTGSYGKQILYKTLAQVSINTVFVTRKNTKYCGLQKHCNESFIQAVISPSVGAVMDYITEMQGQVITINN